MKIAVTDACIFICLRELDLIADFFRLDYEICSSLDVVNELYDEQKLLLLAYLEVGNFKIYSIQESERIQIRQTRYPAALSEADKTVLFLAEKLGAIVVSSDNVVRKYAKKHGMEIHGILWIVDRLVETNILSNQKASGKLEQLLLGNVFYQNNPELTLEIQKRLKCWRI